MRHTYDVFLSYSRGDRESAEVVANELEKAGLRIWFDRWQIRPGQRWITALQAGLKSSKLLLVFIGRHGLGNWAQTEIAYGLGEKLKDPSFKIIPILGPGANSQDIPGLLTTLTYLDLGEWRREDIARIATTIKELCQSGEIMESAPRIFLCHAREDQSKVDELYFVLKDEGFDPWYDKENLVVGDNWKEEIFQAIEQSDFFAIFLSLKAAKKSGFIQREIRTAAREFQKRPQGMPYLLPIRLEPCQVPPVRLDENTTLADLHWVDVFEGDRDAVRRLTHGVWTQWRKREPGR